jgi:NTP pyrophosphatase (non-canonical NTP hydrolase)
MALSRDDILAAEDLPRKEIEVPEWKGSVFVRGLTGEERDEFEHQIYSTNGDEKKLNMKNMRARLLSITLCDGQGKRLFTDADIEQLGKKNGDVLTRLFLIAQSLSGLGADDVKKLAKNSKSARPDSLCSASAGRSKSQTLTD